MPLNAQKRYLFHNYSTRDGLINNCIYSINQDKRGYMWFATVAGVSRYDGYEFNNHVIPEINDINMFSEYIGKDFNGNLIITSFGEGLFVEQPNGSYQQYLLKKPRRLGKNIAKMVRACPDGKLLVSSGKSIYLFKDEKFKQLYTYKMNGGIPVKTIEYDDKKIYGSEEVLGWR